MQAKRPLRKRESLSSMVKAARQNGDTANPEIESRGGGIAGKWVYSKHGNPYLVQGGYVATVFFDEPRETYGLIIRSRQRFTDEEAVQEEAEVLLDLLQDG